MIWGGTIVQCSLDPRQISTIHSGDQPVVTVVTVTSTVVTVTSTVVTVTSTVVTVTATHLLSTHKIIWSSHPTVSPTTM
jgi:hypothetical protein